MKYLHIIGVTIISSKRKLRYKGQIGDIGADHCSREKAVLLVKIEKLDTR